MQVVFSGKHKSITQICWTDIPKLAILTGANGSGKSQLLELIANSYAGKTRTPRAEISGFTATPNEVLYQPKAWSAPHQPLHGDVKALQNLTKNLWNSFTAYARQSKAGRTNFQHKRFDAFCKSRNKKASEITREEFVEYFEVAGRSSEKSIFEENLANHFLAYFIRKIEQTGSEDGITTEQFEKKYGQAPWGILNAILNDAGLPYKTDKPQSLIDTYRITLSDTAGNHLGISDLSSGEQVILSTGLWLFSANALNTFPKLLLLDEPDAHLHPSMATKFIDVLQKSFIERRDIRCIMTTHSPSTVAMAPDDSVFLMTRHEPRIRLVQDKNEAIASLTDGLVVVTPSSKVVLVEDADDQRFYEAVTSMCQQSDLLPSPIPLLFVPVSIKNRTGDKMGGGRNIVENWVPKLRDAGLKHVLTGLTDLDNSISSIEGCFQLDRYSIENYLLDPLVICSCLIGNEVQSDFGGVCVDFGKEHTISKLPVESLNLIVTCISKMLPENLISSPHIRVSYCKPRVSLNIPEAFIKSRGKDLLVHFRNQFGGKIINHDQLLKAWRRSGVMPCGIVDIVNRIINEGNST